MVPGHRSCESNSATFAFLNAAQSQDMTPSRITDGEFTGEQMCSVERGTMIGTFHHQIVREEKREASLTVTAIVSALKAKVADGHCH